jgi:hypothetical protein
MRYSQLLPLRLRAVGIMCAALAATACDDDGGLLAPRDGCETLRQTAAEIDEGRAEGEARVRISVISQLGVEAPSTEQVSLNGAELYVGDNCYRMDNALTRQLTSLENAMGVMVAEASIEPGEATHVLLRASGAAGGRSYREEKVALDKAVRLEPGTRTDIYLALSPVGTSNQAEASYVAAGMMPWDATTMVYDPTRGGKMSLPGGFAMEFPAGSVSQATVFGVGEHAGHGVSGTFNIWPESEINEPVTISVPVDRSRVPQGLAMSDFGGRVKGASMETTIVGNTATVTSTGLGQVRMATSRPWIETTGGERMVARMADAVAVGGGGMNLNTSNPCYQRLVSERANLYASLDRNAGIYVSLCEDVSPKVHIVMVNLQRPRQSGDTGLYPRVQVVGQRGTDGRFALREMTTHMSTLAYDFAAINGFTWEGQTECCGGWGTPNGTVYQNGTRVSPWWAATEVILGFGPHSGTTGTASRFFERLNGASINITGYTDQMVPSTTSIIKGGVCSRSLGGELDRWSAIGIGNGVLVMASSVTDTETTAYELCSVFEGLNVLGGAIRTDGGRSAAISWLGTTLNLLSGLDYASHGYERDIPYVLAASTQ